VVATLQSNINLWQGGLAVTGGSLSSKKSSWCLLAWRSQGTRWSYHTIQSFPSTITIKDGLQQLFPVRRINPSDGLAMVGVIQSLSGN